MYVEIYIDVVFIVNFIMDFIILIMEKHISKKETSVFRIVLGAFSGAVLICLILIIPKFNYVIYLAISYFISSIIIVLITFRPQNVRELFKLTFLLYIIAIVLGGIIFALYYYTSFGYGINRLLSSEIIAGIDIGLLLVLLFFAIIIFFIFVNIFLKVSNVSKNIYDIKILYKNNEVSTNALLDTGNNLYDPITNFPVIIGEIEVLKNLISEENYIRIKKLLLNIYNIQEIENIKKKYDLNIRLIPYSSLGNDNGMLVGIVLDKIIINKGQEKKSHNNVIIGIYDKKLSKDNSYKILLHPKLI